MKRLLCIVSGMNAGGAETFLMKMYRSLDKSKYQFDFCVNDYNKNLYEDEIISMGGKMYRIPYKSKSISAFKKGLTEVVKNNHYQYVLRITSNGMGFYDLKVAHDAGAKRCIARSSNSSDGTGLKQKIAHKVGRALYQKYVDVEIAPSDLAAEYSFGKKDYQKGKVHILHNGLDLNVYQYSEEGRKRIREELNLGDAFVVGHVGRFNQQKNHVFLVDIFNEIKKQRPNSKLLLVGKGELQPQIQEKVKSLGLIDDVIFAGVRKDIPDILSAMDTFVFPSFYEGMPNTVIEAQALGLPCFIADTITKEANVTGKVKYLSLNQPAHFWADIILPESNERIIDSHHYLQKAGYAIDDVASDFIKIVFGD